jgi:hypothetical protein
MVRHARRLPLVKQLNAPPQESWRREGWEEPFPAERIAERIAEMVATAYLFAAYLDRRTRAPIPPDGRFYLQLLFACLDAQMASWSHDGYSYHDHGFGKGAGFGFVEKGIDAAGLLPGVAFMASHEAIEALLAKEIALFFKMTRGK